MMSETNFRNYRNLTVISLYNNYGQIMDITGLATLSISLSFHSTLQVEKKCYH